MQRSAEHGFESTLARGLGWFSIALGVTELLRPREVKRRAGTPAPEPLVRAYGLREIVSGLAILNSPDPNRMVWTRVAGDILDLATLAPGVARGNTRPRATAALWSVLLITAVDLYAAAQRSPTAQTHTGKVIDYSDRSGFPRGFPRVPAPTQSAGRPAA